jgi:hypothetical protein
MEKLAQPGERPVLEVERLVLGVERPVLGVESPALTSARDNKGGSDGRWR